MSGHVLVPMGRNEASENALRHALSEYPDAEITVLHVTEPSDPLGIFGDHEPEDYMVPDCDFDLDGGLLPDGNSFSRAQRKRAEQVFDRACTISDEYEKEINPVVRSGNALDEIVEYVEEHDVDEVVIGEHPKTNWRPVVREVSEAVAHSVSEPVTVIC